MSIPNAPQSMEFGLGETADAIRDTTARWAADRLAPRAAEIDETNTFARDLWPEMGELGLHGITVEEEFGGLGLGYLEHCVAMEEVSRASASIGLSYGAHSNLCVNQIRRWGTDEQRRRYLPKLISGEHVGSLPVRPERHQVLDHQRAACRDPGGLCPDRRGQRRRHRLPDREGHEGVQRLQEAGQDGHARVRHRRAGVRGLRGSGRERHGRRGPGRGGADERARLRARRAGGRAARDHAGGATCTSP